MVYRSKWVVVFGTLVVTAGCATGSGTAASPSSLPPTSQRVLGAEEIQSVAALTAYQAVKRLRPQWLRRRGVISIRSPGSGQVVAYVDGVRVGGAEALERVQAVAVVEMEYLSGSEATTRFGEGHGGGAILVRTH